MTALSHLPPKYQSIVGRFVDVCRADERVSAALLVGSRAAGKADEHSDLDLVLVTTDEAYLDVLADRESFGRLLGEPLFLEDFDIPDHLFCIYPDGAEVEIKFAKERVLPQIIGRPYQVLVDKKGLVAIATASDAESDREEAAETVRRQIFWFWHDLSHFVTAMARGQLWWAKGQLEVLRGYCVNLARLEQNLYDDDVGSEPYFKVESAVPVERLAPLQASFCPMEREAMMRAVWVVVNYYQPAAQSLAQVHEVVYPAELERVMLTQLKELA
ncbi:MAG: aminoglycoside 6-adenylyltransferase [Candidatus Promineifilaceae bacterium]